MKLNRKDSQTQVASQKNAGAPTSASAPEPVDTSNVATTSTAAVNADTTTTNVTSTAPIPSIATTSSLDVPKTIDEHHHSLMCNVSLIGWMGVIASLTVMLGTGLTMQYGNEVLRLILSLFRKTVELEHTRIFLKRLLMMLSTCVYVVSAVNVVMNILLLIGVRRRIHLLLLPWLLFHGFVFGLSVHMAMYMTISGLMLDFKIFAILLASFSLALVIFFKVSFEVFLLYKALHRENRVYNPLVNAQMNTDHLLTLTSTEA